MARVDVASAWADGGHAPQGRVVVDANIIETEARSGVEADGLPIDGSAYESPELVELGAATSLLRGITMDARYYDCGYNGVTNYRPTC